MTAQNVLFIMSDEHSRKMLGCYGNSVTVKTPTLDSLAEQGTVFENAYTNCPICVPSRASFATGRYVHEIGTWRVNAIYGHTSFLGASATSRRSYVRFNRQASLPLDS